MDNKTNQNLNPINLNPAPGLNPSMSLPPELNNFQPRSQSVKVAIFSVIGILVLAGLGIIGYYFLKNDNQPPNPNLTTPQNLPIVASSSLIATTTAQQPSSLQLISQIDITPTGQSVYRPDVTAINGELWLAYNSSNGPMLQRLDASLNKIGQAIALQSAAEMTTDIRIGSADGQFWMAYESVLFPEIACDEHFLNIASYTGYPPQISKSVFHIAKGCALNREFMENPTGLPANPEIVDDPTPFYHKGAHYILTRAWGWNKMSSIHHLRKLKADMTVAEDILLDTSKVVPGRQMSQSALLHIDDKPFLVAGFPSGMWVDSNTSDLYIIQLSDDLRSFSGKAIRLPVTNTKFPTRITRARYVNGTLIINFNDTFVFPGAGGKTSEYLALFDVASSFSLLSQLQTQDHEVMDNHSSFEILGDQLYLFQQQNGEKISAKIFQLKSSSSDMTTVTAQGKCGDGVCDSTEKSSGGKCPQDCR